MTEKATRAWHMSEAAEALTVMLCIILVGVVVIAALTGWL